ncbi:hypothetical protein Tco_1541322 [Tanacetum coccineum]
MPTKLKELPYKFIELIGELKELKKHVHELEIELPRDLKDIPNKLETFTSTVKSLTTQAKIKTLDALPSLLNKVTEALNKFAQVIDFASQKTGDTSVPSVGQADTQPAEGRRIQIKPPSLKGRYGVSVTGLHKKARLTNSQYGNIITEGGDHVHEEQIKEQKRIEESAKAEVAKHEVEVSREELVDLLSPDVVSKYYKSKLQYDKYCDKMLNRRAKSRITNCDVLTRLGPIALKVYREDGAGWSTIYEQTMTRIDYLHHLEAKLGIDLGKPLSEQDPLDKLHDLAKKKRKNDDDIHDYFMANKRIKSSVQYKDHPARTVLNEPVLGMIMFNSYHMQDFVIIEDFKDLSNEMMYIVQEIFFKLHQGLGIDDHARTFSSFLLAEIDKRNLNALKQMRTIEKLRQ